MVLLITLVLEILVGRILGEECAVLPLPGRELLFCMKTLNGKKRVGLKKSLLLFTEERI